MGWDEHIILYDQNGMVLLSGMVWYDQYSAVRAVWYGMTSIVRYGLGKIAIGGMSIFTEIELVHTFVNVEI